MPRRKNRKVDEHQTTERRLYDQGNLLPTIKTEPKTR